jgi:hypothetical protein
MPLDAIKIKEKSTHVAYPLKLVNYHSIVNVLPQTTNCVDLYSKLPTNVNIPLRPKERQKYPYKLKHNKKLKKKKN